MKFLSSICFGMLLLCGITSFAQTPFTAYDHSSLPARAAWDQYMVSGTAPDPAAFDKNNPYDRSLELLMAASMHTSGDSVLKWVSASVLVLRDKLDTLPFIMPVPVMDKLSDVFHSGREQLIDGLLQLYYLAPWQCSGFYREKEKICREKKNDVHLAFSFLNEALLYSEVIGKPERALPLIDSAVGIWTRLGDQSQLANNIKARGIAYLRLKKYKEAEKEIRSAMKLYAVNNIGYGVSSCQLDLVLLFALSGEPDSMKKYDQLCRPGFEAGDTTRLFVLNTNRLAAYQTANQYSIRDIAKQNHDLLVNSHFHPSVVIDFYKNAIRAFEFFGEATLLKTYRLEYELIKTELTKPGYWPGLFK